MKRKRTKHSNYMLLVVIIGMAIIVAAWGIWFFPKTQISDAETGINFANFKRDVLKSFSVFAPLEPKTENKVNKVNIDDLRARVFGDTIER